MEGTDVKTTTGNDMNFIPTYIYVIMNDLDMSKVKIGVTENGNQKKLISWYSSGSSTHYRINVKYFIYFIC